MPAYLDHAASSPLRPTALEAMLPWLADRPANPSGAHRAARRARRALDDARDVVAELAGAEPGDVVFTSGGTEADNLAITGGGWCRGNAGWGAGHDGASGSVVVSAVEHHAVLEPALAAGAVICPVDHWGRIDLGALAERLSPAVRLVSVQLVNNEVGVCQPLRAVADLLAERAPAALLHTDAVQAPTWLDVASETRDAALVSLSAHKLGGPKGVGALVVRRGTPLRPQLLGGGQERGRRSGTPNVAGIVGFAAAAAEVLAGRARLVEEVSGLRRRLLDALGRGLSGWRLTVPADAPADRNPTGGDSGMTVPGIVHLEIDGVEAEALLFLLDEADVATSAGASCSSGAVALSHVVAALGRAAPTRRAWLRLSLGWSTTAGEIDAAAAALIDTTHQLRCRAGQAPGRGARP